MIRSSRRALKAKAMAEVLALLANAHPPRAPHRPRRGLNEDEWLFENATEFCEALEKYAEHASQSKGVNH